ncbi:MAG: heavy-metal-associated domain-containing protein [Flavobacteriales bacterium]|nr:heavy-metal-associated domain-containing protein [Flavobacteriales bacterium]MCB9198273.1 heavy-metal-associated domain-containing protein [Flavobacteriales bacterium]
MKVVYLVLILAFTSILSNCSSETETEQIVHTKSCTIEIEGMMCEKGCKTTIQNRIQEMDGVINGEVDYNLAMAFVTYDANRLSCEDIIKEIESIGDGLYSAKKVEDKDVENLPIGSEGESNEVSVDSYSFEVPNVTDLFTQIL